MIQIEKSSNSLKKNKPNFFFLKPFYKNFPPLLIRNITLCRTSNSPTSHPAVQLPPFSIFFLTPQNYLQTDNHGQKVSLTNFLWRESTFYDPNQFFGSDSLSRARVGILFVPLVMVRQNLFWIMHPTILVGCVNQKRFLVFTQLKKCFINYVNLCI